jgi:hypothetical protein
VSWSEVSRYQLQKSQFRYSLSEETALARNCQVELHDGMLVLKYTAFPSDSSATRQAGADLRPSADRIQIGYEIGRVTMQRQLQERALDESCVDTMTGGEISL